MNWLLHFLRGSLRLLISGAEPEQVLNRCAAERVPFWAVERREPFVLAMTIPRGALADVERIAARCQCEVTEQAHRGLPFFLRRFRKRYALLVGLALSLLLFLPFSRVILTIDVVGNEQITTAEILSELRQRGVYPGVFGPSIDQRLLSHEMLLGMKELSFFSLNLHGTRAEVIVRESNPKPPIETNVEPADIIAKRTGIVTDVDLFAGMGICEIGETVLEGDLLISGIVDIEEAEGSTYDMGQALHRAKGEVYARTWHTILAKIPMEAEIKVYTGQEKTRFSLNLLGRYMKFYGNGGISYDKYDKISHTKTWQWSDGSALPLSLERETIREYETQTAAVQMDAAEDLLKSKLHATIEGRMGQDGKVLREDYVTRLADGYLEVTLLAECEEQIGKTVPIREDAQQEPPEEAGAS